MGIMSSYKDTKLSLVFFYGELSTCFFFIFVVGFSPCSSYAGLFIFF